MYNWGGPTEEATGRLRGASAALPAPWPGPNGHRGQLRLQAPLHPRRAISSPEGDSFSRGLPGPGGPGPRAVTASRGHPLQPTARTCTALHESQLTGFKSLETCAVSDPTSVYHRAFEALTFSSLLQEHSHTKQAASEALSLLMPP